MLNPSLALALLMTAVSLPAHAVQPVVRKPSPAVRAPAAPVLAPPDLGQVEAAAMVLLGESQCDDKHALVVQPTSGHDGYVDVAYRKLRFVMKPVLSSTGAIRLEDVQGRVLMLQIAYKSMLMDTRAGRRLADNCVHHVQASAQRAAEEAAAQAAAAVAAPAIPAPEAAAAATPALAASQPG
jgi:hypothetical protein